MEENIIAISSILTNDIIYINEGKSKEMKFIAINEDKWISKQVVIRMMESGKYFITTGEIESLEPNSAIGELVYVLYKPLWRKNNAEKS